MTPWFVDQYASTYDDFGEAAIDLMEIMKQQLENDFEGRMAWLGDAFSGAGSDGGMGVMAVVQYFRVSGLLFSLFSLSFFLLPSSTLSLLPAPNRSHHHNTTLPLPTTLCRNETANNHSN